MGLLDRFRKLQENEEQAEFHGPAILHAYRMPKGLQSECCPRCQGELVQKVVNLIYSASHGQFRQNVSPCAYLCEGCSVAVIDESIPRLAAEKQNFEYLIPLAAIAANESAPEPSQLHEVLFRTYEGHDPAYVLNEDEQIENVVYEDELGDIQPSEDDDDFCPHCVADNIEQFLAAGWNDPATTKSNDRQKQRNKRKQQKASRRANRRRR